ncbi:uncharacterized protein MYCFIDRAFT_192644 [Pseudocercospora fijiensis CIRAD86]|uniref:Uncharacterized protein n=1 Tax=Pseudocercospora fijiensis (strain CIRAD86) TaxID=383855 RepID=N1QBG6_PSEFD|nr:uncharacterized protein MYCFIDRAFT_192644 [Pseudocercospora fijiensis CIRAD86]EME88483.1 hypothetical protein MYCFIDRAFT_192644 [Pseudocercospora fijiensis CIRAD86]
MAFGHLFLALLISTISLIASIIFLTTTTNAHLRYFYVAWTTVSAALVWILVCVSACLWSRRCEGAMEAEPRKQRIGRTIFEVCWPNGSQGSFHSYHRDRPQTKVSAPAKRTHTASPASTPSALESGKSKHNRTSSQIPMPPTIYSQSRHTHTPSDSMSSERSSNSRTALIYPDSNGFFHDPGLTKPRGPAPPMKQPWCGCGQPSSSQLSVQKKPSLIYPDSNGIYHNPNQSPNVSPLSQIPLNRHSAVSALSLDTEISQAKLETASVMRATRPQTINITPPKSTQGSSSGGVTRGGVVVDESGSPRKVVSDGYPVVIHD